MYWRDEKTWQYAAPVMLVLLPWLGSAGQIWGWILEMALILAVLWVGQGRGVLVTAVLLTLGYLAAVLSFPGRSLTEIGYVPWAALVTVWGWKSHWPAKDNFFWSLVAAGILAAVPLLAVTGNIRPGAVQELINAMMKQYQEAGQLAALQQQGLAEADVRRLLEEVVSFVALVFPGLVALAGLTEYGVAYYLATRLSVGQAARVPFSRWRLPWYAVWGVILALLLYLAGDQLARPALRVLGINLMLVYGAIALVLGAAVYVYFLLSPRIPRLLKWGLILTNLLFVAFSVISVLLFGLFDLVLNFRRLPEAGTGDPEG